MYAETDWNVGNLLFNLEVITYLNYLRKKKWCLEEQRDGNENTGGGAGGAGGEKNFLERGEESPRPLYRNP